MNLALNLMFEIPETLQIYITNIPKLVTFNLIILGYLLMVTEISGKSTDVRQIKLFCSVKVLQLMLFL